MPNFLDKIKKIYDKEIRLTCDKKRNDLINCLKYNNNSEFMCNTEIKIFQLCLEEFNFNFKKKYSKITTFKIIN